MIATTDRLIKRHRTIAAGGNSLILDGTPQTIQMQHRRGDISKQPMQKPIKKPLYNQPLDDRDT